MSVWGKTWQRRAEHRWNRRLTRAPKCRNLYQPKLPKARSDEWIERLAERFVYGCETEADGDELTGGEKSCRCLCAAEVFLWASSASTRCLIFDPIWNDSSAIFHPPIHLRSVQLSICHSPLPLSLVALYERYTISVHGTRCGFIFIRVNHDTESRVSSDLFVWSQAVKKLT